MTAVRSNDVVCVAFPLLPAQRERATRRRTGAESGLRQAAILVPGRAISLVFPVLAARYETRTGTKVADGMAADQQWRSGPVPVAPSSAQSLWVITLADYLMRPYCGEFFDTLGQQINTSHY